MAATETRWAVLALVISGAACPLPSEDSREFSCRLEGDCAADWTCVAGTCRRRCDTASTCLPGLACEHGGCVPQSPPASASGGGTSGRSALSSSGGATSRRMDPSSDATSASSAGASSSRGPVYRRDLVYVGGGGGAAAGTFHSLQAVVPAGPAFTIPAPARMCLGPLSTLYSQ